MTIMNTNNVLKYEYEATTNSYILTNSFEKEVHQKSKNNIKIKRWGAAQGRG